jgi:hypothetical protein
MLTNRGCYRKRTAKRKLTFGAQRDGSLLNTKAVGHCDPHRGGCIDTQRLPSGFICTLYGTAVHWGSRRQEVVTSTTAAEYVAAAVATVEGMWWLKLMTDLGVI